MVSLACWCSNALKLSCLEVIHSLASGAAISKKIQSNASSLECSIGIGSEIAADGSLGFLVRCKLSGQRACSARSPHARVGMRLKFKRVNIYNEEIGAAPETRVNLSINTR